MFRSTNDLFAHTWEIREWSLHTNGTERYANAILEAGDEDSATPGITAGAAFETASTETPFKQYHTNDYDAPLAQWQNESLVIAEFDIDLKLTNYAAAALNDDTKNYVYYDYTDVADGNGATPSTNWKATRLANADNKDLDSNGFTVNKGEEVMTRICVFKNDASDCTGYGSDDLILVEVTDALNPDGSAKLDGTPGPEVNLKIGVRKVLGVATTCGISTNSLGGVASNQGDVSDQLSALSKDIFVWAGMDATADLRFQLITNKHGNHLVNGLATGIQDVPGNAAEYDENVTYSLTVSTTEPETHDLLFIEEPKLYDTATHFTSHPDADGDGTTEYRVDLDDLTYEDSTGAVLVTADDDTNEMACSVAMTTFSANSNHWHCYRNAASQKEPNSQSTEFNADATHTTNATGGTASNVLSALAQQTVDGTIINSGTCQVQLTVSCSDARPTVTLTDNRECSIPYYGPQADAQEARRQDFKSCVDDTWFSNTYYFYNNEVLLTGTYDSAIVQAVRLFQKRRYPVTVSTTPGTYIDVGDKFGTIGSDNWECDGDTTCASADPYKVLDFQTVGASVELSGLVASTKIYDTSTYDAIDNATSSTWTTANPGDTAADATKTNALGYAQVAAVHTDTATWDCTDESTGCGTSGSGPNYDSGKVDILDPPYGYPESYVFGVVSFDFQHGDREGATADAFSTNSKTDYTGVTANNQTESIQTPNDDQQGAPPSRRLRSSQEDSRVAKTFIVQPAQYTVQK
jgi:hypothetical protein